MTRDDFDRVLGMLRTQPQARNCLTTLIRLFTRSGFDRGDIASLFTYIGRGLGDGSQLGSSVDWLLAAKLGDEECRRGAFEEFYDQQLRNGVQHAKG